METWVNMLGFDRYEVSDYGRVRNKNTGDILKPMKTGAKRKSGYRAKVRMSTIPRIDINVAHAVLESFGKIRPDNTYVSMHLNDEPMDNRLDNLKWGTRQDNARDCAEKCRGGIQKLSASDISIIRTCRAIGMSGRSLAKLFTISEQRICDIYKGRTTLL